jgi:DNA-binding MarR family transcriptional regulator/GNAT superfamily N-acetyltransferase
MSDETSQRIEAVRRFSRFYTTQIRLLDEGLLASPYTLTEARVIYELAQSEGATATEIAGEIDLDPGYMSRIIRGLERRGLVEKRRSEEDRRRVMLSLSPVGRKAFTELDTRSREQLRGLLGRLDDAEQGRLVEAMETIQGALSERARPDARPFTLRPHRPGDIGWVVERHGALYAASHGWDGRFEAMCAEIGSRFLRDFDPRWERSWIAERHGRRVGAVFLVRRSKTIGQLRFLFVDPDARGLGLGARLVSECVGHARHVGYRKMTLYTMRGLDSARRLYEAEGFQLTKETPGEGWAEGGIEQRWDLTL